jgi:hypothetical protein
MKTLLCFLPMLPGAIAFTMYAHQFKIGIEFWTPVLLFWGIIGSGIVAGLETEYSEE